MTNDIFLGNSKEDTPQYIQLKMANRHGLITGTTGTGKTVTLQTIAEQFSSQGIPVFSADVKGDLSGLGEKGSPHPKITERVNKLLIKDFAHRASPVNFWDMEGETGIPLRTTSDKIGPLLFSKLLDANDTQSGIIQIAFRFAKDHAIELNTLDDLKDMLNYISNHSNRSEYGNISKSSVAAIIRDLLVLEDAGADTFLAKPALNIKDIMHVDSDGRGQINLLDATSLIQNGRIYGVFLMWLISELFEQMPEAGDPEKPKMVFFFDEAHLLFNDASKALLEKIEMVVRLIRSKGVGIYFVTQSPTDIPDNILAQLGNRVQHALRSYTPSDQKNLKAAAKSFRVNPRIDTEKAITELGIGEALVSTLDEKGMPSMVEHTLIAPPRSKMGPISPERRQTLIDSSILQRIYSQKQTSPTTSQQLALKFPQEDLPANKIERTITPKKAANRRQGAGEAFFKSFLRSIASRLGTAIIRSLMKGFKK